MCGIFGLQGLGSSLCSKEKLLASAHLLQHRGPDNHDIYFDNNTGLVHTRLSLLDLSSRSNQPFWDETGRYCIVYNGEIYNFQELKGALSRKGVKFNTTSDTEVLLKLLIQDGVSVLPELEGMFSFAFYDKQDNSLVLAKDRFGIKPLYYTFYNNHFFFSSEIKAFEPWLELKPDNHTISSFLHGFGGPTQNKTFFQDIRGFKSGAFMIIKNGQQIKYESFHALYENWEIDQHIELLNKGPSKIIDQMDELLFKSVEKHMIADARVGALCSGGVDSSLIMAMASKIHTNLAIFHANVLGPYSEFDAAKNLANHLGLDLNVVEIKDSDFITKFVDVTQHYEQPFIYHPNSIPFLMVTNLVKENNVKAILTGEGADEAYLGYSHIPTEFIFKRYYKILATLQSLAHKIPQLGAKLWPGNNKIPDIATSIQSSFEIEIERDAINESLGDNIPHKERLTLNFLGYHLRTLLHRNDRLGMASSIEARFPFLDNDLIRFSINLPYKYKIRKSIKAVNEIKHPFFYNKWVLRQVANRYLPKTLSQRPKKGFPTNAYERMHVDRNYFHDSAISEYFQLSSNEIDYLYDNSDGLMKLKLLHLDVWHRLFINSDRPQSIIEKLVTNTHIN